MDAIKMLELKQRVSCGEFNCLAGCSCTFLMALGDLFSELGNRRDRALFINNILCCDRGNVPSIINGDIIIPRRPRDPNEPICDMRTIICDPTFMTKLKSFGAIIAAGMAAGLTVTDLPELAAVGEVISEINDICAHPDTAPDFAQQAKLCGAITQMEDAKDKIGQFGNLGRAAAAAISQFLATDSVNQIRDCCRTNPTMTPRNT